MAKTMCMVLGVILILVGIFGFAAHGMMGMHLSPLHNVIHLVSGALALYFGWQGSPEGTRAFCLVFGLIYGLLGLAGFLFGSTTDHLLTLIPNQLMLGTADHIIHVILGAVFAAIGLVRQPLATSLQA